MKVLHVRKITKVWGGGGVREEEKHNVSNNFLQSAALQLNNEHNPGGLQHIYLGFVPSPIEHWLSFLILNVIRDLSYLGTTKAQSSAILLYKWYCTKITCTCWKVLLLFCVLKSTTIRVTYRKLHYSQFANLAEFIYLFIYKILKSVSQLWDNVEKRWIFYVLYHIFIYQYTCINVLWIK